MTDADEKQADEILDIGRGLLTSLTARAADFCRRHGLADPRHENAVVMTLTEIMLEGLMVTRIDEDAYELALDQLNRHVKETLRQRRKQERKKVRYDA